MRERHRRPHRARRLGGLAPGGRVGAGPGRGAGGRPRPGRRRRSRGRGRAAAVRAASIVHAVPGRDGIRRARCGRRRHGCGRSGCGWRGCLSNPRLPAPPGPRLLRLLCRERFLEPADDRRLDRGGRRPHELAHFLELGHHGLALYAELLREFVYPDLRHCAPSTRSGSAGPVSRSGQRVLRPASASAVHRRMLIGRSSQSQPALPGPGCPGPAVLPRPTRPRPSVRDPADHCPAVNYPAATGQDTRQACRSRPVPAVAAPARMPVGAALPRSIPGWDAGKRPGQALAPADRERSRSRLPPGEASRTWPHGLRIPHRSGSLARAGPGADTA